METMNVKFDLALDEIIAARQCVVKAISHVNNAKVGNELPDGVLTQLSDLESCMNRTANIMKYLGNIFSSVLEEQCQEA